MQAKQRNGFAKKESGDTQSCKVKLARKERNTSHNQDKTFTYAGQHNLLSSCFFRWPSQLEANYSAISLLKEFYTRVLLMTFSKKATILKNRVEF